MAGINIPIATFPTATSYESRHLLNNHYPRYRLAIVLTFPRILIYVLLPQAMRQIMPVWVNTGAELVKASTLLSVIGTGELLLRTQEIVGRNFMTLEFYGLCGLLYFLINSVIERLGKFASRRFALQ